MVRQAHLVPLKIGQLNWRECRWIQSGFLPLSFICHQVIQVCSYAVFDPFYSGLVRVLGADSCPKLVVYQQVFQLLGNCGVMSLKFVGVGW